MIYRSVTKLFMISHNLIEISNVSKIKTIQIGFKKIDEIKK